MRVVPILISASLLASSGCVSRSVPIRPSDSNQVEATEAEAGFSVALAPLDTVLRARAYLLEQGLGVLPGDAADRLHFAHPFLDDRYTVSVIDEGGGASRVIFTGRTSGRDRALAERVEALTEGLREHLSGTGPRC